MARPYPIAKPSQAPVLTQTLARGLMLLRAFRAERVPLTNAELVRRTGMSRSSISRLTITLANLGYLRRVAGESAFELAWGGFDLGYAYAKSNPIAQRVNPLLQELADRLNVTAALAIPDGLDMLYIACRTSTRIATLRLEVGSLLPMGLTAIGRAWLWALPRNERQRHVAAILQAAGSQANDIRQRIEQAFDDLSATGVCMAIGEYQHNAYGLALPLRIGQSRTLMAMNCGAVGANLDLDAISSRIAPELKETARKVETLLQCLDFTP